MDLATMRERIQEAWSRLSARQKALAGGGAAALLLAVSLALTAAPGGAYAIAYTGLSTEDAAAIVSRLREQAIPYQVSAGESIIRVPAAKVHDVRLDMASAGLPSGGTVGFEVFDGTNFGMTDFTQQLNFRRGLEGELARTIGSLESVEQARVHIVIPQATIYTANQRPPTASVLVKLVAGRRLSEGQVEGITHLVSTSIEGLTPENITIVDTKGTVLNDGLSLGDGRINGERFRAQQDYEASIEAKVRAMLETVLGPQRSVVTVHADMDWTQVETSTEAYEPSSLGSPVMRSAREVRESYGDVATAAEGVPGVSSALPSVPTYPGTTGETPAEGSASSGQFERSELTYDYELSRTVSHTTETPGKVTRLNVSVLLDEVTDEQQLELIRQAVAAAAGVDADRGDRVIVETVAFDRSYYEEQEQAMARVEREQQYMGAARWGAIGLAAVVALLLIRGVVVRRAAPGAAVPVPIGGRVTVSAPEGATVEDMIALQLPTGERLALTAEQQSVADSVQRHHQLVSMAQKQPELLAGVVQLWLQESRAQRRG